MGFDDAARNVDEQGAARRASSCSAATSSNATNRHMKNVRNTLSAATTSSKAEQHACIQRVREFDLTTKKVKRIADATLPTAYNQQLSELSESQTTWQQRLRQDRRCKRKNSSQPSTQNSVESAKYLCERSQQVGCCGLSEQCFHEEGHRE